MIFAGAGNVVLSGEVSKGINLDLPRPNAKDILAITFNKSFACNKIFYFPKNSISGKLYRPTYYLSSEKHIYNNVLWLRIAISPYADSGEA